MSDYVTFRERDRTPRADAPTHAPRTKPAQALADAIVDTLAANGPQSAAEMAALLPLYNAHTIRTSLGRMARTRRISRVPSPKHETLRWKVGPSEAQSGVHADVPWTPGVWVHPHLARRVRPEPEPLPLDFADPRRKAA